MSSFFSDLSIGKMVDWTLNNKLKIAATATIVSSASFLSYMVSQKIYRSYWKSYPPGPLDYPFIGISPYWKSIMAGSKDDAMTLPNKLAQVYGDICLINIMGWKVVYLNNSGLTKMFTTNKKYRHIAGHKFIGTGFVLFSAKDGTQNFFSINGPEWVKRRKLFVSIFTKILTTKFMNKVAGTAVKKVLIPEINKICIKENKALKPREIMRYTAFQTVFYANFDRFVDKNDELFIKLRDEIILQNKMSMEPVVFVAMNDPNFKLPQKFYDAQDKLSKIINDIMDQRRAELREKGIDYKNPQKQNQTESKEDSQDQIKDDGDNNEDLYESIKDLEFESYLDYLLKLVDEGKITNEVAEVDTLLLFNAGYQNVAMSLEWTLNLLAKYPEIQNKIRDELFIVHDIKNNMSNNKVMDDNINEFNLGLITKCPLFRAFIYETLRISAFARAATAVKWNEDIDIEWKGKKYVIPKDHIITTNLEYIMKKSENEGWKTNKYGEKLGFNLNNFLDKDGKFKIPQSFASFGYGIRDCPGKAFAIKEMQFISAYLIMNYMIEFGDDDKRNNPTQVEIKTNKKKFTSDIEPEIALKFSILK